MSTHGTLDFYDDPDGELLRSRMTYSDIPEFIKTAQSVRGDAANDLNRSAYALIAVDNGRELRKYACVDKGNTALSVMYFMENRDKLPEEAQKVAAANLCRACVDHDLAVPTALVKVAGGQKAGQLLVDITGKAPASKVKLASAYRYCIPENGGRFPIDTYGQVKQASAWFEEHGMSLPPSERKTYCEGFKERADELGIDVPHTIQKYASNQYADPSSLDMEIRTRQRLWETGSPENGMYARLLEKCGSVTPDVFCEALTELDRFTGASDYWDSDISDPVYATYGAIKTASDWVWLNGNERLTSAALKEGVNKHRDAIVERFGEDMAVELQKSPTTIFDSLPTDTKIIISRLVQD